MTNRLFTSCSLLSASMLLASCSTGLTCGNSHPYAAYHTAAPLKAPAGVTMPVPDPAYVVPAAGTAAKATAAPAAGSLAQATPAPGAATNGSQPCLVIPPDVLTKSDMEGHPKAEAPAKPTVPIGTHPGSGAGGGGLPQPGGGPPPVARPGSME